MKVLRDIAVLPDGGLERASQVFGLDPTERSLLGALVDAEVSSESPRFETVSGLLVSLGLTRAAQAVLAPEAALRRFALVNLEGEGPSRRAGSPPPRHSGRG